MKFTLEIEVDPNAITNEVADRLRGVADLFDTGEFVHELLGAKAEADDDNYHPSVCWEFTDGGAR